MTSRPRLISSIVMVVAGLALAVGGVVVKLSPARADVVLGSYSFIATAPGMEVTEDEPIAQAHPEGHGAIPYTTSILSNGLVGYGLSSIAWPGATFANAGAVVGLVFPSQVAAGGQVVPMPDAISGVVKGLAPAANYPVRAEARTGSAPDASFSSIPGVSLTAHADPAKVEGVAAVQSAEQPGTAKYGNMHSDSVSTLTEGSGQAMATSVITDIDIGGAVKIKSVTSTATAQTDGTKAQANGGTVVQGLTIGGQSAYLDQGGLHIGEPGQPVNAAASALANQALAGLGMTVYVSQPQSEIDGSSATYNAGSVLFRWEPPNNPNQNVFTATFGGSRVSVAASEGSGFEELSATPESSDFSGDVGAGTTSEPPLTPSIDTTSGETPLATTGSPTASVAPSRGASRPTSLVAATFAGLPVGWVLLGLAVVALLGAGSWRLLGDLLDRSATPCPLETRRS
jgi:hypothetical protein